MIRTGAFIVLLLTLLVGCADKKSADQPAQPTATSGPGTVLDPPREVGDFTLTSQTGDPLHLSDLQGKVVLLFFGYTHCPDVCPITLSDFKRVKANLGETAAQVAFVFVSVDGERDTPERLAEYIGAFDPDFIGLTGDDTTIKSITQDYGVFYQRESYDDPNYLVTHTASTFVLDAQGRLHTVFPYATDPVLIADGVRALLRG
ncbi:MAG TPA: SCO family protein [Aggregatilineaceae bacterium]|nr:SCO family protein [Aggregatilineaceae bacterium]